MSDRVDAVFAEPAAFVAALKSLRAAGVTEFEVFGPANLETIEELLPRQDSPVRFATLLGGLTGVSFGFYLCAATALVFKLIVGGKVPVAYVPYTVVAFELTILLAGLATFVTVLRLCRVGRPGTVPAYRPEYGRDRLGISVSADHERAVGILREAGAEAVHD